MSAITESIARLAEQQAAEAELAGDDWPDGDTRRFRLRRGRWMPVDDLPDIAAYQPTT